MTGARDKKIRGGQTRTGLGLAFSGIAVATPTASARSVLAPFLLIPARWHKVHIHGPYPQKDAPGADASIFPLFGGSRNPESAKDSVRYP